MAINRATMMMPYWQQMFTALCCAATTIVFTVVYASTLGMGQTTSAHAASFPDHLSHSPDKVGCCSALPTWMTMTTDNDSSGGGGGSSSLRRMRMRLPCMIVTVEPGVEIVDEPKVAAHLCVCDTHRNNNNNDASSSSANSNASDDGYYRQGYAGRIGIELRGHSSQRDHEKKSFAIELRDAEGDDVNYPLLGFPADDDWILYGAETDRTLGLRNFMAYEIFREGMGRYASRAKFVELFIVSSSGAGDSRRPSVASTTDMADPAAGGPGDPRYMGLYMLGEKIKSGRDRVMISDYNRFSGDRSGGFIFKYDNDNIDAGDEVFQSSASGLKFIMREPKDSRDSGALQWLRRWMSVLEGQLQGIRGNSDSISAFPQSHCMDMGALVDYFLLTELTKNPDGYRGSTYMHKGKGSCLVMGPAWDYNEAFGQCCGFPIEGYQRGGSNAGIGPEGWRFSVCDTPGKNMCRFDPVDGISWWYQAAWKTHEFRAAAALRWRQLRQRGFLRPEIVLAKLQAEAGRVSAGAGRNYMRWCSALLGTCSLTFDEGSIVWRGHVAEMAKWLDARMTWMDSALRQEEPKK